MTKLLHSAPIPVLSFGEATKVIPVKKQEKVIGGLVIGLGVAWLLNAIATNPRTSPFWRQVAQSAEGDIFQHVISGELVTLLA